MRNIIVAVGFYVIALTACNFERYHFKKQAEATNKTHEAESALDSGSKSGNDSGNLSKNGDEQRADLGGGGTGGEAETGKESGTGGETETGEESGTGGKIGTEDEAETDGEAGTEDEAETDGAAGTEDEAETDGEAGTDGEDRTDGEAGSGGEAGTVEQVTAGSSDYPGICPPVDSVGEDGPFSPTHIENNGPRGNSWIFYPQELGKDEMLHPVFNFAPSAGTGPSNYSDHLNRIASHGFVVISQPFSSDGTAETAALDWILAQNENSGSPFYHKLDPDKVGVSGHSGGSLATFAMVSDARIKLYILICGGTGNMGETTDAQDIHAPTLLLGGDNDSGTINFEDDYETISSPVVFVIKAGTDHIACARNNLEPWVAFMRWHFCGEEKWKPEFFEGGVYCKSPWTCRSKGW